MELTKASSTQDYGATLLRLSLGVMYLAHAHLKIFTFTLAGTAEFFAKVGFPSWMAYPLPFAEIGAGILLISGVQTRWVALALIPVLLGATYTHWPNGWVFTATGGGWEYPVFLLLASVVQALLGDGAYALRPRFARVSYAH
jgi:putative oxidoreductase